MPSEVHRKSKMGMGCNPKAGLLWYGKMLETLQEIVLLTMQSLKKYHVSGLRQNNDTTEIQTGTYSFMLL